MAVGWYLRFSLSYRDVEELLAERGERHGSPVEGREVRPDYKLKKFVRLARNHAAH